MTDAPRPRLADRTRTRIPRRPGTGRTRRIAVAVLSVLGIVALAAGGSSALRDASVPAVGEVSIVSEGTSALGVDYADAPSVELVSYEHGSEISYAIELRNDGPLAVAVEDVPVTALAQDRRLIRPTGVAVLPDGVAATDGRDAAVPFEPFRLAPGGSRTVVVEGVFDNCEYYTERAMDLIGSQPVTWSVAGWSTTTDVALSQRLAVRSPHIRICPGRVMDRGARSRFAAS